MAVMFAHSGGRVPLMRLAGMYRLLSSFKRPHCGGNVPLMLLTWR